jgi:hypothetical protein
LNILNLIYSKIWKQTLRLSTIKRGASSCRMRAETFLVSKTLLNRFRSERIGGRVSVRPSNEVPKGDVRSRR